METRAQHLLIGLFTLLAVAAALLFTLWLGKSQLDSEFKTYEVVFREAVSGLSVGSAVQYSGIKVGEVTRLRLDPKDPRQVLALVRVGGETPVKANTGARLALTSIAGGAVIQLYGGTPKSPFLETRNDQPAQILADPSPLSRLLSNGEDLVSNINQLLGNAGRLFSDVNIERVGNTLAHLEQTTASVAAQREAIAQAMQSLAGSSEQLGQLLQQGRLSLERTDRLIDLQGRQIMDSAAHSMAAFERSSRQLEQLLESNQGSLDNGLQGLAEIGPALQELRATLSALRQASQRLSDNPGGLLERQPAVEFQP